MNFQSGSAHKIFAGKKVYFQLAGTLYSRQSQRKPNQVENFTFLI